MLGFGVMSVLLAGVGTTGLRGMSVLNGMLEETYRADTLGIKYIKDANLELLYINRALQHAILDEDAESVKQRARDIERHDRRFRDSLDRFKPLIGTA